MTLPLKGKAKTTTLAGGKTDVNARGTEKVAPVVAELALDGSVTVPACSVTVLVVADGAESR